MSDRTSDRRMKRLLSVICLLVAGVGGATIGTAHGALAATNGNSDAAHACQQAGYLTLIGTNGTTDTTASPFTNTGDCVSYAAHGGTLVSKTAAAPCLNNGYKTLTTAAGQPAFSSEAACVLFVGQGGTPVPVGCVVKSDKYPTIQSAVNDLSCTTIQLLAGTYRENVTINRDVTIQGAGASLTIVNAGGAGSVFTIWGGTVILSGLTIEGGNAVYGGGIYNYGRTLTVMNSTISLNTASYAGGGIYSEGGTVTVTNSTISDNIGGFGGGIFNYGGPLTVTNSIISSNSAISDGGGIFSVNNTTTVTNSTISGNGGSHGGGVYVSGTTTVTNTNITDNQAIYDGGGMYNFYGTVTVTGGTIKGNMAWGTAEYGSGRGGGIFAYDGTVTATGSLITDNSPNNCMTEPYGTGTITGC